jgi:tetratricopeptide (TPR) repeat protein
MLALMGAFLVAGFLAYDYFHLRRVTDVAEPAEKVVAPAAPSAIPAPETAAPAVAAPAAAAPSVAPLPAAAVPQAAAPAAAPADSRPAAPTSETATNSPRPSPQASLAERTALLERAQAAFDEGNLDRAQSEARRAAALGSHEADALLGAIAFKRGNLDEAERLLSKALARDPANPRIARQLQLVRARQGP